MQLEVPRDRIETATPEKGEKYRVSLTDKCLGARWSFASLDELDGVRLRTWRARGDEEADAEEEGADPELREERERERREKYGDGSATMGEYPAMLAMVVQGGPIEFEVV